MKKTLQQLPKCLVALLTLIASLFTLQSCIEPPLKLPAQEVIVEVNTHLYTMEDVWNLEYDWHDRWYYGWDATDTQLFGSIGYPSPSDYEVRRYYLGKEQNAKHKNVDPFTIHTNRFRRSYFFGYYDLLLWSDIDSPDGSQVLQIDERDLETVDASTSVTRGMTRQATNPGSEAGNNSVVGLYNQPEIFYSTYPRNIYVSENLADYDYYDEQEKCWVKKVDCPLNPMTFIYLVQVILTKNDGRVIGTSGNAALTAFSASSNVNSAHTYNNPSMVYFNTRYKANCFYQQQNVQIIGGKFTTFGLCDMPSYLDAPARQYCGSRHDLPNYLLVDISFRSGKEKTYQFEVTEQCRNQAHGGIITVVIDCTELDDPGDDPSEPSGSLFVPTVEDYDEVVYEIPLDYTIKK